MSSRPSRWRDKARKLRRLTAAEAVELWRFWLRLSAVELSLRRRLPLPTLRERLGGRVGRRRPAPPRPAPVAAERLAWLVGVAARHHPLRPACLARSVCLEARLRRGGRPAELRIGVSRRAGGWAAHAWVELDGAPLGEVPAEYRRFLPLMPARRAAFPR